ncbi:uncharacterized protein [Periplaneta americana]|uniref:uncharacterized protein n=1 Tax=Periplaneta americana TaxID=6978 RepID=UPI0037E8D746
MLPVNGIKVGGKCLPMRRCPVIDLFDSITFVAHRSDCSLFCGCIDGNAVLYRCPSGYHFNPIISKCDHPERADCIQPKFLDFTTRNPTTLFPITAMSAIPAVVPSPTDGFLSHEELLPVNGIEIGGKCLPKRRCPLIDLFDSIKFVAHRSNCSLFCRCINGAAILYSCPTGYHFNAAISKCDLPERASCNGSKFSDVRIFKPTMKATTSSISTVPSYTNGYQSHEEILSRNGIKLGGKCLPKRRCPLIDQLDSITFVAHRTNCSLFCGCIDGTAILYRCPAGYHFNQITSKCDLPERVDCIEGKFPDGTTFNPTMTVTRANTPIPSTTPSSSEEFKFHDGVPMNGVKVGGKCLPIRRCPSIDLFDSITFIAHRSNCSLFCGCTDGTAILYRCPHGYHFNPTISKCDYPHRANCEKPGGTHSPREHTATFPVPKTTEQNIVPSDQIVLAEGKMLGDILCKPIRRCPSIDPLDSIIVIAHRSDCSKYCRCKNGTAIPYQCPLGLHFNPKNGKCDLPSKSECKYSSSNELTTPRTITTTVNFLDSDIEKDKNVQFIGVECLPLGKCPIFHPKGVTIYLPHLKNCDHFCGCKEGKALLYRCRGGLHFNRYLSKCDVPSHANCTITDKGNILVTTIEPTEKIPGLTTSGKEQIISESFFVGGKCPTPKACPLSDSLDTKLFLPHSSKCNYFCGCSEGIPLLYLCPANLHFNPKLKICDLPSYANCTSENKSSTEESESSKGCPSCPKTNISESTIYFPHSTNCKYFCRCDHGVAVLHSCADDLFFNPELRACDLSVNFECKTPTMTSVQDTGSVSGVALRPSGSKDRTGAERLCPAVGICPKSYYSTQKTLLPHRSNCSLYCECLEGVPRIRQCGHGLHFNAAAASCDRPSQARCQGDCAKLTHTKGSTWEPATCLQSLSKLEDVCNISCISGYELKGSNSVTCTANGWNSTAGLNLLPTCKAPEELAIEVVEEVSSEIPRRNVDFLFMLDESRSVQEKGFAVEISFVKAVVTAFPLSRNRSAGVMRFSGVPHMDIKMGHSDTCHFLSDIEKIKYVGGRSDINAALQLAIREIQNNTNRKTLIFLITDGRSEIDPTPLTKMLKDQGSIIFIVGLGLYDRSQLETMASVGKDGEPLFYGLTNFQVVKKIADYINTVNGQGVRLNCPKNSHHKD